MDHETFDALTRFAAADDGTRRGLLRLLTGSALGSVAARLGRDEQAAAKAKKHSKGHDDHKPSGKVQAAGKKHKGKNKHNNKDKRRDRNKTPAGVCDNGKPKCPDGSCALIGECCPGYQRCSDGFCHKEEDCCDAVPPLCLECQDTVCEDGTLVCRPRCLEDEWCCNGACRSRCSNGCESTHDCGCSKPPEGKVYCSGQERCVNDCPPGEILNSQTCQCKVDEPPCGFGTCPAGYLCDHFGGSWDPISGQHVCASGYSICNGSCCQVCYGTLNCQKPD